MFSCCQSDFTWKQVTNTELSFKKSDWRKNYQNAQYQIYKLNKTETFHSMTARWNIILLLVDFCFFSNQTFMLKMSQENSQKIPLKMVLFLPQNGLFDSMNQLWSIMYYQSCSISTILINFDQSQSNLIERITPYCEIMPKSTKRLKSHRVTCRTCETHLAVKKAIFLLENLPFNIIMIL